MSGTWLVSYGVLWTLLLLNFVLAYAITTLLARVRARWHDDMRQFEIPFVGSSPQPRAPVYIDLSGGDMAGGAATAEAPSPAGERGEARGESEGSVGSVGSAGSRVAEPPRPNATTRSVGTPPLPNAAPANGKAQAPPGTPGVPAVSGPVEW